MTFSVLAGTLTYALGQAFNLAFQFLLLHALGFQEYGRIGLAHLAFVTLLFVCDLGYGMYFLRERPDAGPWKERWRIALGHRLLATLLVFSATLAFWISRYGSADSGLIYLLAVAPASVAALVNFSAPLLAAGRNVVGFAMQQIAWPVAAICFALTWPVHGQPFSPILLAGGCVSLGYMIQALVNLAAMRRLNHSEPGHTRIGELLTPRFGHGGSVTLKASLSIALLGFLGIANDRLTAFLIEDMAAGFLPAYLLLGQLLGGASGMLSQFNRLLVAGESSGRDSASPVRVLAALLLAPMALLLLAAATACAGGCWKAPAAWLQLISPILVDWMLSVFGGGMVAVLIGRHHEGRLARIIVLGVGISIMLQLGGAWLGSADAVLWGRVLGATVALQGMAQLSGIKVPPSLPLFGVAAALGSLLQARLLPWPVPAAASVVVLLTIMGRDAVPAFRALRALCSRRRGAAAERSLGSDTAGADT